MRSIISEGRARDLLIGAIKAQYGEALEYESVPGVSCDRVLISSSRAAAFFSSSNLNRNGGTKSSIVYRSAPESRFRLPHKRAFLRLVDRSEISEETEPVRHSRYSLLAARTRFGMDASIAKKMAILAACAAAFAVLSVSTVSTVSIDAGRLSTASTEADRLSMASTDTELILPFWFSLKFLDLTPSTNADRISAFASTPASPASSPHLVHGSSSVGSYYEEVREQGDTSDGKLVKVRRQCIPNRVVSDVCYLPHKMRKKIVVGGRNNN